LEIGKYEFKLTICSQSMMQFILTAFSVPDMYLSGVYDFN